MAWYCVPYAFTVNGKKPYFIICPFLIVKDPNTATLTLTGIGMFKQKALQSPVLVIGCVQNFRKFGHLRQGGFGGIPPAPPSLSSPEILDRPP